MFCSLVLSVAARQQVNTLPCNLLLFLVSNAMAWGYRASVVRLWDLFAIVWNNHNVYACWSLIVCFVCSYNSRGLSVKLSNMFLSIRSVCLNFVHVVLLESGGPLILRENDSVFFFLSSVALLSYIVKY